MRWEFRRPGPLGASKFLHGEIRAQCSELCFGFPRIPLALKCAAMAAISIGFLEHWSPSPTSLAYWSCVSRQSEEGTTLPLHPHWLRTSSEGTPSARAAAAQDGIARRRSRALAEPRDLEAADRAARDRPRADCREGSTLRPARVSASLQLKDSARLPSRGAVLSALASSSP